MRAIRVLAVAALVSLDFSAAAAQTTRHFENSWFWGAKGGLLSYQVFSDTNAFTWLVGGDWLITRKKGRPNRTLPRLPIWIWRPLPRKSSPSVSQRHPALLRNRRRA